MTTIATLFSGGNGIGVGARMVGIDHLWSIEYDPAIAAVAESNGFHTITASVMDVDPATLEVPDILHASPVCKNFSVAKTGKGESDLDLKAGEAVARFIDVLKPKIFTLENAWLYRSSKAFRVILAALDSGGYVAHWAHLDAADFGVPQHRKRLILRASRIGLLPNLATPELHQGWYKAIEDLIPSLPDSAFVPWQLARLPLDLPQESLLVAGSGNTNFNDARPGRVAYAAEPAQALACAGGGRNPRAFIVSNDYGSPVSSPNRALQVVYEDQPAKPVKAGGGGRVTRAWIPTGRVVAMSLRALARFQSFPDDYMLPAEKTHGRGWQGIGMTVIGNAVPPLWYAKLVAPLKAQIEST